MASASSAPYLALNVPQALSLPSPSNPEKKKYESVWELIEHRATHALKENVAVGFAEVDRVGKWECTKLTYGDLPRVARCIASELRPMVAKASSKISPVDPVLPPLLPTPVIAILSPSGLDFLVHTLAAWSLGLAILPIAIGTTKEGAKNLLRRTGACAALVHDSQKHLADEILALFLDQDQQTPDIISMNDTHEVVKDAKVDIKGTTQQPLHSACPNSVLIIFHSSGSTGLPKPIYHITSFWSYNTITASGRHLSAYTTTPLYHGGMSDFLRSLQAGSSIFFHPLVGATSNTLSVDAILSGHTACTQAAPERIAYFLSVPFILEMLSHSPEGLQYLAGMDLVSTGGAPLPTTVGDLLVRNGVPLVSRLGSSECGFLMSSFRDFAQDKEWSWLRIEDAPTRSMIEFREDRDNEGLFELIVTGKWPAKLLSNASDDSFSTQDLYSRHEDHENWYKYATRVDDTLVLLNGKKFAAGLIETRLKQSELVQDAVVFGSNRALVGAIIIHSPENSAVKSFSVSERYQFLKQLSPHLVEINKSLPPHARLVRELIHVADDHLATSIPRSSKGTLQRGHASRQLNPLFDEIYSRFERGEIEGYPQRRGLRGDELRDLLASMIGEILHVEGGKLGDDEDFYKAGMDSLSAVRIKAGIHQYIELGLTEDGISRRLETRSIYDHPTVSDLADYIDKLCKGEDSTPRTVDEEMLAMVEKYSSNISSFVPRRGKTGPHIAILTGATGALGSHLLHTLVSSSEVDLVICLVRASSDVAAQRRVQDSIDRRSLQEELEKGWKKILCFASDLSDSTALGISRERDTEGIDPRTDFWSLISSASSLRVIHAAWSVNFALSLKSFEGDSIAGLSNLLNFSLRNGAESFVFCSSIASILAQSSTHLQEKESSNPSDAGFVGYSQSKWVAEKLCSQAVSSSTSSESMAVSIARIGQLTSDSQHGVWNESEAWPLMIRTAVEIGKLPMIEQSIDWLSVDVAARAITDLTLHQCEDQGAHYYHVTLPLDSLPHEKVPTWMDFLDYLDCPGSEKEGIEFERVPLEDWLEEVKGRGSSSVRGRSLVEGIWSKLIPHSTCQSDTTFQKGETKKTISTTRARGTSKTLRDLATPVDISLVRKTIQVWKQTGFL